MNRSHTLPDVIEALITLKLLDLPEKRKPLVALEPSPGLFATRRNDKAKHWWDSLAYYTVNLEPDLNPLQCVLLSVLRSFGKGRIKPYQASLGTIIGVHRETISDNLTILAKSGYIDFTQETRQPLRFNLLTKPKTAPAKEVIDFKRPEQYKTAPTETVIEFSRPKDYKTVPAQTKTDKLISEFNLTPIVADCVRELEGAGMPSDLLRTYAQIIQQCEEKDMGLQCLVFFKMADLSKKDHHANYKRFNIPYSHWWRVFHYKARKFLGDKGIYLFAGYVPVEPVEEKPIGYDLPLSY